MHLNTRRALLLQAATIVAVIGFFWWLTGNTLENLAARGISSGFGFLNDSAGFGISMSLIAWSEESSFGRAFFVGLLNTLLVSAIGVFFATIIGFIVGIARLSSNWLASRLAAGFVETIRNIPLLLQIFFWYFAVLRTMPSPRQSLSLGDLVFLNNRGLYVPGTEANGGLWFLFAIAIIIASVWLVKKSRGAVAIGVVGAGSLLLIALPAWQIPALAGFNFKGGMVLIPELVALAIALSTYTAAFIAEIVRAGVQSVDKGQTEAARALGLSERDVMWRVVMPQAMRLIIPPLTNQYLNLTKNSSLAAAIAYPDLVSVFAGTVLNITGQAIEVIAITMAVYLAISLMIAALMAIYNRRVMVKAG